MPVTKTYAKGPSVLASYDIFDIITGIAYEILYAGVPSKALVAGGGILRSFVFDSENGDLYMYTSTTLSTGGTYTFNSESDFDIDVGRTMILQGDAVFSVHYSISPTGKTYDFYYTFKVRKVDKDGVETEIASGNSKIQTGTTAVNLEEYIAGGLVTIPKTAFKAGEKIRITIEVYSKDCTSGTTIRTGHDPANKAEALIIEKGTILKIWLPFKVEI